MTSNSADQLTVALAQIAPVWLNREATLDKVAAAIREAATAGSQLVAFGEALVPGYPKWIEMTNGAAFNSPTQKQLHAHYMDQAVQIESGHLEQITRLAAEHSIAVVLGIIERPVDRGGHSLYASVVYIDPAGVIQSVHRKLMPTYEERLSWSPGDGHGLRVHPLGPFTVGALNCWENWMPLARTALSSQGEDLHVAIWPGSQGLTKDITRFVALEGRSFMMSASGLLRASDISNDVPCAELILKDAPEVLADGGSCLAGPDGEWIIPPTVNEERVIVATIDHARVREERQNFDPVGHYSRPDVFQLSVNRDRQSLARFGDPE